MRIYRAGRLNRTLNVHALPFIANTCGPSLSHETWTAAARSVAKNRHINPWTPSSYLQVRPEGYDLVLIQDTATFPPDSHSFTLTLDLALVIETPLVGLLYRFGREMWRHLYYVLPLAHDQRAARAFVDQPWSFHQAADLRVRLVEPCERRVWLDQHTKLDPVFSRLLHRALRDQAETSFDPATYVRTVSLLTLAHPTPASLHERALAETSVPI